MLIVRRILATLIDIVIFFIITVSGLVFVLEIFPEGIIGAGLLFVFIIAINTILQWPFLMVGQTIGKAFFGLLIVSIKEGKEVTPSLIIQREIFGKILPVYFTCILIIIGKKEEYDKLSDTDVVIKTRSKGRE